MGACHSSSAFEIYVMLGFHYEAQKVASYRSFAPIEWSESLRSWCVFDPEFMVAIMKSPDFVVVDFVAEYAKLERERISAGAVSLMPLTGFREFEHPFWMEQRTPPWRAAQSVRRR